MLPQHRELFSRLPFSIIGHIDDAGRPWASLLAAAPGFIQSPTPTSLILKAQPFASDPLARALRSGAGIGLLGIDLATRRRNRVRGTVSRWSHGELELSVVQSFGNCPRYISFRTLDGLDRVTEAGGCEPIERFGARERAAFSAADTLFIASGAPLDGRGKYVVDASHRGGRRGFIRVADDTTLMIPDFAGNNHFNTLGNIALMPRAGLLLIDFEQGDVTMVTGTADVIWDGPNVDAFHGATRVLRFRLETGRRLVGAFPWRGRSMEAAPEADSTGTWAESAGSKPPSSG
jgi:predicted pyridoxine 5'-phosphate oxidase superfamily flavin-nucleotide-binding protein